MYLERLLQINMATLAALGGLLLGMGQRSVGPPLLIMLAAATSVWVTDITDWFRLGQRTANVLMIVAAVISLRNAFPITVELQALDFTWFVIYLQVILLFQEKDEGKYWLLVMLSLLQVIVATLFNQGIWFGVLLMVYMLLGFSAMTLLMMYRQWRRVRPLSQVAPKETGNRTRWPLAGQKPDFVCSPGGASHSGIGRNLFGRLGCLGLYTLAFTLVMFFTLPRFGQTTWRGPADGSRALVGYSGTVALGELGQVIDDPNEVMRVRFFDPANNNSEPIHGEIYLQGAILMTYNRGHWETGLPSWDSLTELLEPPTALPRSGLVWQDITIKSLDHPELFFIAPFVALKSAEEISFNHAEQRLLRSEQYRDRQFGYRLGTTAIVRGAQQPLTPSERKDSTQRALQLPEHDGKDPLPSLKQLAQRWIDESGLPAEDRVGRARYLERQLAGSGQFQYSLTGQSRNPDIDPIEDFVTEHRQGHCEYFATALTLMLRSQGIPARMVVGYKCDEWNPAGRHYLVRQLHAHTWVQAYLYPRQLPPELLHGNGYWPWQKEGGWLRLDPTPGGAGSAKPPRWSTPIHGAMDWLDSAWANYVRELDYERQREAIYAPVGRAITAVYQAVTDPKSLRVFFSELAAILHINQLSGVAAWFAIALAGILAGTFLAFLGWLLWQAGRRLMTGRGNRAGIVRRSQVEFYRRFETLLARQGIRRTDGQTQREFAEAAGKQLAQLRAEPELMTLPTVVVEAFYRVRFGCQPLDNPEAQAVEHAVAELAAMLKARR